MNLGEIMDTIRHVSGKFSANDMEDMIRADVNRAYRRLCRARTFGELVVRNQQFQTVAGTFSYVMPYPLDRILNDSVRYDVTSTMPGGIVKVIKGGGVDRTIASALYPAGSYPITASLGGPPQDGTSNFALFEGTATYNSVASRFTTADTFDSSAVGKYVRFGTDSNGFNPGDYGYLIDGIPTSSSFTISEGDTRGPDLVSAPYVIRPSTSLWLTFDPTYIDTAKTVQFDWYRKPARLYSPDDVLEIDELGDAIVYRVLADNPIYHRPQTSDRLDYGEIAREYLLSALKVTVQ